MIWNSLNNTIEEALTLPEGNIAANFGFLVQQSVNQEDLLDVVAELKHKKIDVSAATQSGIMVKAQKAGLLQDWAELVNI